MKTIKLPPRSPNLSPHAERFVKSIKSECLAKMIFFREKQLRRAIEHFIAHYHAERNHQGVGNRLLEPGESVGSGDGEVRCRRALGGLLPVLPPGGLTAGSGRRKGQIAGGPELAEPVGGAQASGI